MADKGVIIKKITTTIEFGSILPYMVGAGVLYYSGLCQLGIKPAYRGAASEAAFGSGKLFF